MPGIVLWTCFGIAIGTGLVIWLRRYQLDDGAATVIGSALGSAMTITGALMMAQAADRKAKAALRSVAIEAVQIVCGPLELVRLGFVEAQEAWRTQRPAKASELVEKVLLSRLRNLSACAAVTRQQFDELRPVFHSSGAVAARAQYHISHALRDIQEDSKHILQRVSSDAFLFSTKDVAGLLDGIDLAYATINEHLAEL